jgi:hypothetical protein
MPRHSIPIRAGLLSGGGAALWTLFEYALGWHNEHLETGAMTGFVALIFPTAAILWALHVLKRSNAGRLTLRQALVCGLSISAISAALGVAFFYAYYAWINPAFLDAMAARGHTVDIPQQLLAVVIGSFTYGILMAGIAGLIMRTRGDIAK